MFKFTQTIIVNSDKDSTGVARWTTGTDFFNFKRALNFKKEHTMHIYKRAYSDPKLAKAILKMDMTEAGNYRLALYVRLSGSQNSYYSNDFVFKGKPFYVEFEVKNGDNGNQIATRVANFIKKLQSLYGMKWLNISAVEDTIVIEAIDEYQRFKKVDIEYFVPDTNMLTGGTFEVVKSAKPVDSEEYDGVNQIHQGKEGFGTWWNLTKDLHLPTLDNVRFAGLNQEERPIMGAKYNQYTIYYRVNRGIVGGAGAVGEEVTSITCHVFYVNVNFADSFEAGLKNIGTIEEVSDTSKFAGLTGGIVFDEDTYNSLVPATYREQYDYAASESSLPWVVFTYELVGTVDLKISKDGAPCTFSNIPESMGVVAEDGQTLKVSHNGTIMFDLRKDLGISDSGTLEATFTQGSTIKTVSYEFTI